MVGLVFHLLRGTSRGFLGPGLSRGCLPNEHRRADVASRRPWSVRTGQPIPWATLYRTPEISVRTGPPNSMGNTLSNARDNVSTNPGLRLGQQSRARHCCPQVKSMLTLSARVLTYYHASSDLGAGDDPRSPVSLRSAIVLAALPLEVCDLV